MKLAEENITEAPTLNRVRCPRCNAPLPKNLKATFTRLILATSFGGLGGAGSAGSVGALGHGTIQTPADWYFECPSCNRDFTV